METEELKPVIQKRYIVEETGVHHIIDTQALHSWDRDVCTCYAKSPKQVQEIADAMNALHLINRMKLTSKTSKKELLSFINSLKTT